tara:strand:- start:43 stop:873 length:831 start_codon:yes stop_codon:yes gene_type:complete
MSKKKKQVFNEDFLKIKSNIPSLKKGESAESFRKRVKMWSSRTGLEFPTASKQKTLFGAVTGMTKEAEALAGKSGTGQGFGIEDFSSGYSTELNKLVQSNIRRFDANQKADKLRIGVPKSGMSDLRGAEGTKADEEQARQDKILFGEDLMNKYFDPNNPDNDFDAGPGQTDLQIARAGSFNPDTDTEASLAESLKIMQGTDTASRLAQNSTMADQLRETNARMGRIERENRLRLGDERVDFLKQKQVDFKSMDRKDFAKKYPKSQTAKRLKLRLGA